MTLSDVQVQYFEVFRQLERTGYIRKFESVGVDQAIKLVVQNSIPGLLG